MPSDARDYNGPYREDFLNRVAFPMGGIGAGMFCLEGTGALSHFSLRNTPEVFNEPMLFSAICLKGEPNLARVIEGPVPMWKAFGLPGSANGCGGKTWGLPRFASAEFEARFPFGKVTIEDPDLPVRAEIAGWSPFVPGDADSSSLPVAGLEYRFVNTGNKPVEAIYSFNSANFMGTLSPGRAVLKAERGLTLHQPGSDEAPWDEGSFNIRIGGQDEVFVNAAWFRGGWFDPLTMAWKDVTRGVTIARDAVGADSPSPGGSIFVPFSLKPGEEKTIPVLLSWYAPLSALRHGKDTQETDCAGQCATEREKALRCNYRPWYSSRFDSAEDVASFWTKQYASLKDETAKFADCFHSMTLAPEVVEAVAANLAILKSPTVLRQADGKLWAWEGCHDGAGCCPGSCTHVWNYAQAIPHLFPELERSLRETEFTESQDERGHQVFRSALPIRPTSHDFHAASDGQLGGIIKVYRDWRISGDTGWLRKMWPRVKASLNYCIVTWDPRHRGLLEEPHHNTYDIEFWGPDGMCTSFYLGALQAAVQMGKALNEETELYAKLLDAGCRAMETELWDGEYFCQRVQWEGLSAKPPTGDQGYSPEALELLQKEGPKYQYGKGCISDGVLGAWMAAVAGLPEFLDGGKVAGMLKAIYRHNFRSNLRDHANPQRPTFAFGQEAGLLLCSWPKGGALSLPFPYGNEVWTGIEYQAAAHMIMNGLKDEGLELVRAARGRYDGRHRSPFDEYECGHWYARAMSSYTLLQALSGARYDAVGKTLYLAPAIQGDFRSFLCTATGYGTVGVRGGRPFVEVVSGSIPYERISYTAFPSRSHA